MNIVIAGEYKNSSVCTTITGKVYIKYQKIFQSTNKIMLNKENIASYTIIDKNEKTKIVNGIVRSAVGGAMFGVAGAVVGATSAKKKRKYMLEIEFNDGKHSTIEIDYNTFKLFVEAM